MDFLPDDLARIADQLHQLASGPEPDARRRILDAVSRAQIEPTPVPAAASRIRRELSGIVSALGNRRLQPIIAGMLVFALAVPLMAWRVSQSESISNPQLSSKDMSLIGGVDESLASQISFDQKNNRYVFDQAGKTSPALPDGISQDQTGGGKNPYSVDLPLQPKQGLTYYDNSLQLQFSLIPNFVMGQAQESQGRVVYGMPNSGKAVYTVKSNGLKEDLVYDLPTTKETFSYSLKLPSTLEARMIPNSQAVGIYSADRSLFQHISFGSDADKTKVMQARLNSQKNNLVFAIAPPSIKQSSQKPNNSTGNVRYNLSGNTLNVVADGLSSLSYPISIDPSVVVNTTAGFALGNNEGGINFGTNQISEGGVTGGTLGAWTNNVANPLLHATYNATSVAYNGYVYEMGGWVTTYTAEVDYAPINANGTIGTWTQNATSLLHATDNAASVAYNGYLYEVGGYTGSATAEVDYALVCTGNNSGVDGCGSTAGTIGTWTQNATSLLHATYGATSVAYNGYLYEIGGCATTCPTSEVDYAPINADGTIGTWTQNSTSLLNTTYLHTSVAYNGYVYVIGGWILAPTTAVEYAPINANGTIGTWATTTSLLQGIPRYDATSLAYNGYIYEMGGCWKSTCSAIGSRLSEVDYAPINANGTIGAWTQTYGLLHLTSNASSVAYNGYLYEVGGSDPGATTEVDYALIQPAGYMAPWTATVSISTTADDTASSVAYNGYLYVLGGCPSSCSSAPTTTVQYDSINADGTLGATWTTSANALPGARARATAVAYNGYIYEIAGCSASCTGSAVLQTTVYYSLIGAAGAPGAWSTSAHPLGNATQWANSFVYNGYIYEMGGCYSSCPDTGIFYSQIQSTGDVGAWSTNGTSLPLATDAEATVAYDGYVFVLGVGGSALGGATQVNSAPINTNGSIGTWSGNLSALPHATQNQTAAAFNGYIWMVGGYTTSATTEVDYVLICTGQNNGVQGCGSTAGTLGTWSAATVLPAAAYESAGAIYNGFFYNIGGNGTAVVDYAPLDAGGSGILGSWTANGNSLLHATDTATSVAYNGYVYEIGGTAPGVTAEVDYAPINGGGTVGTWTATTSLLHGTYVATSVAYNGYVYEIGGCTSSCSVSEVDYALICTGSNSGNGGCGSTAGTIGTWTQNSTSLLHATYDATSVAYNGYLYEIGGRTTVTTAEVDYAPINADGSVGAWTATTSLLHATLQGSSVAYNGYLYEIGGAAPGQSAEVDYAPLNSDGTVGAWTATTSLMNPNYRASSIAYNGYLYEIGGSPPAGVTAEVDYAPINANGSIGAWTITTNLLNTTYEATSVAYNGYLYEMGGFNGSSIIAAVDYAPLNVMPMVGHYSYLTNIGNANNGIASITYTGSMPAYSGPGNWYISYRSAPATGVLSASALASSLSGINTAGPPTCNGTQQYFWVFISVDDSNSFTFGGDSLRSNLTSFTINYGTKHPAPNQRLRGGQYFLGTTSQPLDTCYP